MAKKIPTKKKYAYHKKFRTYVKKMCVDLRKVFFAGEYEMDVCWCDEEDDERENNKVVAASITQDEVYLNFTIHIKPQLYGYWKQNGHREIARCIVHEFCHLLVDPVWYFVSGDLSKENKAAGNDIRERQVQRICNVVWDGLPEHIWNPKKMKKHASKLKLHRTKKR